MPTSPLDGKRIVLGISGGISAYKGAELCRLLVKAGARVRVVMTKAATAFIAPLTLQALSGARVGTELLGLDDESEIGHIKLADEADLVLVAPATADVLARFAAGMADDLLSAVVLATRAPVLVAPAMNVNMWEHPLTQQNLQRLVESGRFQTVGPDAGPLACGWIGAGRLVEPGVIAARAEELVGGGGPLARKRVVVTAGPTFEAIDDVRFIGNRSSGKMGFALAEQAARLGADVTLLAGPVALATPAGVARRVDFESAAQLAAALDTHAHGADVVVMAAAVADFRPAAQVAGKLDRRAQPVAALPLQANPDLLAGLAARRQGAAAPLLVGFAAELAGGVEELRTRARRKLLEKGCDVIIGNDVGAPGLGFGSDRNAAVMVFRDGTSVLLPEATKTSLAASLWQGLLPWVGGERPAAPTPLGESVRA